MATRAWEAGGGRVALQVLVTSFCAAPVALTAAPAQPQGGLRVAADLAADAALLPALLQPRASLCLGFLLEPEAAPSAPSPSARPPLGSGAASRLATSRLLITLPPRMDRSILPRKQRSVLARHSDTRRARHCIALVAVRLHGSLLTYQLVLVLLTNQFHSCHRVVGYNGDSLRCTAQIRSALKSSLMWHHHRSDSQESREWQQSSC